MSDDSTPRVWVGSLAAYNSGSLIGDWFDATEAPIEPREWVDAMADLGIMPTWEPEEVRERMAQVHEEIWVFDHENFRGFLTGECSPAEAVKIAEALADAYDMDMLEAFMSRHLPGEFDSPAQAIEKAQESYMASDTSMFSDARGAAWEYLEDTGYFEDLPERFEYHKDAIVRDWLSSAENGGEVFSVYHNGVTYLFSNG